MCPQLAKYSNPRRSPTLSRVAKRLPALDNWTDDVGDKLIPPSKKQSKWLEDRISHYSQAQYKRHVAERHSTM